MSVADRMEFGIQSALCPAYETRGAPFFAQACRRAVGLEVSGVNHQRAIKGRLVCQLGEAPAENTEPAQPDEPIVQRLVRTIFRGSILPLKSMFDNVKNAADDVPVIGTGDTVRAGKEGLIRSIWLSER